MFLLRVACVLAVVGLIFVLLFAAPHFGRVSESDELTVDPYENAQDLTLVDSSSRLMNNMDTNYNFDGLLEDNKDNVDETVIMEDADGYNQV